MQAIAVRNTDSGYAEIYKAVSDIQYFPLDGILVEGEILSVNVELMTVQIMSKGDDYPFLLKQQQFTASEGSLLFPLLANYPHHCPYEIMFASFYNGVVTEETIERARRQLQDAEDEGVWDSQMRPIRNVLSRVRFKLRGFKMDIVSILETGYILMAKNRR